MMAEYTYNSNLNVLEVKFIGDLDIKNVLEYYDFVRKDKSLPKNLKVLIDCSQVKFKIETTEVVYVKEAVWQTVKVSHPLREAIIVDQPYETVIATLFGNLSFDIELYNFAIFCTKEAALDWLSR